MENYKPNSHRSKEVGEQSVVERKKVDKVIKGTATVKKKSKARKFTDIFISEDVNSVKHYIFTDVLIPSAKKLISDIVKDGIEMLLYGGNGPRRERSGGYRADTISYNRYSDRSYERRYDSDYKTRNGYSYDEIYLDSRGEAEEVLSRMDELIDTYGVVAVADLYDLVGITGSYTDNKYGWTNIRNAEVMRVRDRYTLKLPRPLPID